MSSNIDKYKKDLEQLIKQGSMLLMSMQNEHNKTAFIEALTEKFPEKEYRMKYLNELPSFNTDYQTWYSESLILIKQLLPSRLQDFINLYEKNKNRKDITYGNYVIEDALINLRITRGYETVTSPAAAIPKFEQQLSIVKSLRKRFESSLFDIKQLVQADIFDSELETAKELNSKGFVRGAGAIAGVVLEAHLNQVCVNHNIIMKKKDPSIADYNDKLKEEEVIETSVWRKIQMMSDIRNLCDHKKTKDPLESDVNELVDGVEKIIKTVF